MFQKLKNVKATGNVVAANLLLAMLAGFSSCAYAGPPSIGNGGGSAFGLMRTWIQNFIDFVGGPFGIAAVVVAIILAFLAWSYAPKDGIIGPLVRVVTAGLVVINVSTWVASFGG